MSDVFFIPFDPASGTAGLSQAAVRLFQTLLERSGAELPADVPLKVHFGEKGNRTYLKPEVYDGIIDFIQAQGRTCHFVETSVLYGGERFSREKHLALAEKHGFTRIPAIIADSRGTGSPDSAAQSNSSPWVSRQRGEKWPCT